MTVVRSSLPIAESSRGMERRNGLDKMKPSGNCRIRVNAGLEVAPRQVCQNARCRWRAIRQTSGLCGHVMDKSMDLVKSPAYEDADGMKAEAIRLPYGVYWGLRISAVVVMCSGSVDARSDGLSAGSYGMLAWADRYLLYRSGMGVNYPWCMFIPLIFMENGPIVSVSCTLDAAKARRWTAGVS